MGFYTPLNTKQINAIAGKYSPSTLKAYNNATYEYWERSLFQRASSRIQTKLPHNWEGTIRDFLLYCLLKFGFVFVSQNEKLGYWFQPGTLYGIDFYYQPTEFILANPRANDVDVKNRYKLHEEGELLKFMPDFRGIFDIISYYAEKLSNLDSAINVSIINSKMPYILAGKNKAAIEALKKMMDKINKGESAIYIDKILQDDPNATGKMDATPFQILELQHNMRENYITTEQLQDFQSILNSFDAEIGINTLPYQKSERFVSAEASARMVDSQARIQTAIECLNSSVKCIKELYPNIELEFSLREEVIDNGISENNLDGDV